MLARLRIAGLVLPAAAALTAWSAATPVAGHGAGAPDAKHHAAASSTQPQLQYQSANAPVETKPAVYLVFWGEQWQVGWTDVSNSGNLYTSAQAQSYITGFFHYVSSTATAWNGTTTQYCQGVAVGATSCSGGKPHVTNPPAFGGAWVDTTSPPPPPLVPDNCAALVCVVPGTSADAANLIAAEAVRAEQHFLGTGNNPNADFMILLPQGSNTVGGNAIYCAYHSQARDAAGRWLSYTNMPFVMNSNVNCGENFVNQDSAFGNGFFDGYSIVAGHEFAEAETDPLPFTNTAWQDLNGNENGDKCAWITPGTPGGAHDIGPDAAGHVYAVQTLWSNSARGCAD